MDLRTTCCFSGHRPEKLPGSLRGGAAVPRQLGEELEHAVRRAFCDGYRLFVTGMSRGFDLWAAQTVLRLRGQLPLRLLCAVPFDGQAAGWDSAWQQCYRDVLKDADFVYSLARHYTPDCFYVRNRFMVDGSSRLIGWYGGEPGGTAFTFRCAKKRGLEIVNLADPQLSLYREVSGL